MRFESRFPQVKKAAREGLQAAVDKALVEGQDEAQQRIQRANDRHGYNYDPFQVRRKDFPEGGGMIFIHSEKWYYRFLEYGSVYIPATPFMRPAHRKMRKVFKQEMADDFEKFVSRRVRRV